MCGIAGIWSTEPLPNSAQVIREMVELQHHRGPDANGVFESESGDLCLGHNRLSILDLSERANQPYYSADGRYAIVYNGEVYNYRNLAKELKGFQPRTTCDTEIILECYIRMGKDCLNKFNGMFALAIWDLDQRRLFLARDRMGIKPLYYYRDNNLFAFSSELKALDTCRLIKSGLSLDPDAFQSYLHLGFIPHPLSVYREIRKLPPGHFMQIGSNLEFRQEAYWDLPKLVTASTVHEKEDARVGLRRLITEAVQQRLISDVPLGTFLSGGIDSSLVSAIACSLIDRPLKTFSIGFKETKFDESQYAVKVANHLRTEHHSWMLKQSDAIPLLDEILGTYDEPFADTSALPTMMISRLARENVKVILTGDGGDELFLGYGSYHWAERLESVKNKHMRNLTRLLLNSTGQSRLQRASHLFSDPGTDGIRNHIFSQEQYFFSNQEIAGLVKPEHRGTPFSYRDPQTQRTLTPAERQSLFDLTYYLRDDLMTKVDRASMKFSLECRVPLLDHRVVAYALNLDPKLKRTRNQSKLLLKEVLYEMVPAAFFDRPKWGFSIPLDTWLTNDLHYLIEEFLDRNLVADLGYFNEDKVKELVLRFKSGQRYLYNRLWLMILWHKWITR